MGQDLSEVTEQVVKFPPKQQSGNPADEAGQAVIAQIRKAAELANENCDRAMALAHKLAMQLRAAEDQITQLEAEVALFRDRATRAEGWLQTIHSEIEQKLIAPRSAFGTEQTLVSSNSNTEPSQPSRCLKLPHRNPVSADGPPGLQPSRRSLKATSPLTSRSSSRPSLNSLSISRRHGFLVLKFRRCCSVGRTT